MAKDQKQSHTGGIRNWLEKPFPALETFQEKLIRASVIGLTVFLILLILKPYGFSSPALPIATLYGMTSLIIVFCYETMLPHLFRSFFIPQKWTIGKNIISTVVNIAIIAIVNWIVSYLFDSETFPRKSFEELVTRTISISVTPVIIITWMTEKQLYRKRTQTASEVSDSIHPNTEESCGPVSLTSEGSKTPLTLTCSELIFASSEGNYVQLFCKDSEGTVETHTLRITLKSLLTQFNCCDSIVQCHRSYLVNLSHVDKVSGNARGYLLHSEYLKGTIPVSRSKSEAVLKKLSA